MIDLESALIFPDVVIKVMIVPEVEPHRVNFLVGLSEEICVSAKISEAPRIALFVNLVQHSQNDSAVLEDSDQGFKLCIFRWVHVVLLLLLDLRTNVRHLLLKSRISN